MQRVNIPLFYSCNELAMAKRQYIQKFASTATPQPIEHTREFKKTTMATLCGTLQNNGVNDKTKLHVQNYNLVGFSAVLRKITT